ncbi:hypothetical protein L1987_70895 [Smallanthus sonchifolius]|uniref:Uncharacterized protein n=1 Tax=Smallanthus sonchifolius TaxID=185202 RepID=A0ACB9ARK1_9ASTR|nr:hypothetical protein L1987_70895 [Smallanthus sonchifolius]
MHSNKLKLHGAVVPLTGGVKIPLNVGVDGVVAGRGKLGSDGIPMDGLKRGNVGSGIDVGIVAGIPGTPGNPGIVKRRRPMAAGRLPENMRPAKREKIRSLVKSIGCGF